MSSKLETTERFRFSVMVSATLCLFVLIMLLAKKDELLLFVLMSGLSLAVLIVHWDRRTLLLFIISGISFPALEYYFVTNHFWYYYTWTAHYLPFPLWLIPAWGLGVIIIRRTDTSYFYNLYYYLLEVFLPVEEDELGIL